jgi:hypothetical protein
MGWFGRSINCSLYTHTLVFPLDDNVFADNRPIPSYALDAAPVNEITRMSGLVFVRTLRQRNGRDSDAKANIKRQLQIAHQQWCAIAMIGDGVLKRAKNNAWKKLPT